MYDANLPNLFQNVSLFRGSRTVYIYSIPSEIPEKNYSLQIKTQVGGFGIKLFGSSESICKVSFNKNIYYPGERVQIGIDCDNTKCKTSVKSYKFKLFRQLRCREGVSGHFDSFEECIHSVKEPGCKGNTREKKTYNFELPLLEPDVSAEAQPGGVANRTSKAVSFKDHQKGVRKLHSADDSEDG